MSQCINKFTKILTVSICYFHFLNTKSGADVTVRDARLKMNDASLSVSGPGGWGAGRAGCARIRGTRSV